MFCDDDLATPVFSPLEGVQATVLATLLQHPERLAQVVAAGGKIAWFQRPGFRCLWECIVRGVETHGTVSQQTAWLTFHRLRCERPGCLGNDPCALWEEFRAVLSKVTSASFLTHLCSTLRTEEARQQALGLLSEDVPTETNDLTKDLSSKAETLATLAEYAKQQRPERKTDLVEEVRAEIARVQETGFYGLETGIVPLDTVIGGFRPAEVIICGARPSIGKSSFAVTTAVHNARQDPERVILFASAEMRAQDIIKRVVSCYSGVPVAAIEKNVADAKQRDAWEDGYQFFATSGMIVQHNGMTNPNSIYAVAKNSKLKHGRLDLVIVDHMHILRGEGRTDTERVGNISKSVLHIAQDLQVPVLALAQLNRNVEHREDPEPSLADLRASGAIEEDGATIFFLHRPSKDKPFDVRASVAKNRRGTKSSVDLNFVAECSRFEWRGIAEAQPWSP